MLMAKMKTPMEVRTHPRVDRDIHSGNIGVVQEWIVASSSIDAAMLGIVDKHMKRTRTTSATVCPFGLAFGNFGVVIVIVGGTCSSFLCSRQQG